MLWETRSDFYADRMASASYDHIDLLQGDYVVLRYRRNAPSRSIESIYGAPFSSTTIEERGIVAESARLSPSECETLCREKDVLGAAPVIPLHLVPPLRGNDAPSMGKRDDRLWGLEAVGAFRTRLTGSGTVVAILDTGIDAEHSAFNHIRERIVQKNSSTPLGNWIARIAEGIADHRSAASAQDSPRCRASSACHRLIKETTAAIHPDAAPNGPKQYQPRGMACSTFNLMSEPSSSAANF